MAFEIKQSLKLGQSLVMTPQLQQAIKLLQLNRLEMQELINQELVENPVLEEVAELDAYEAEAETGEANNLETMENREAEGSTSEEMLAPQGEEKIVDGKSEIDWEEFYNVLKGNGPCNKERLRTRVKAYEDGAWFREALVAHADKQAAKKAAA